MKIVYLYWNTFNFVCQHILTDQTKIAMSLDLKLKLVEVDVLEI